MAKSLSFEFQFKTASPKLPPDSDRPMRLLVMGDFSGRADCPQEKLGDLAQRRTRPVDVDNLDQTIAQLAPSLGFTLDNEAVSIQFSEFDDFHPDQLYQKTELFRSLRDQRQRLKNPATFAAEAAMFKPSQPSDSLASAASPQPDANLFSSLLGGEIRHAPKASSPVDSLIKKLVGTIPAGADPRQSDFVAALDTVISEKMRALLHNPAFQSLEAAWRGLRLLIAELDLNETLQLHILDVSKSELISDISACDDNLESSALYRLLVEQTRRSPDSKPWSLLVGNYTFESSETDIHLLAALGAIASQARAPFLAAASDNLLGCSSLAQNPDPSDWQALELTIAARWQSLRASPQASWLGLALPRVLLRLPYGKTTDGIDAFHFEEVLGDPEHENYLWGNAAFVCALLLGRAFQENGWEMSPDEQLELGDLPAHSWRRAGEAHMQACAETFLSERASESILRRGLMPLLSFANRNAVRLLQSQSIAYPARALSGSWNS